ncbi:MAG TPA: TonB-dependent receptor [Woeseiaceae bacterium]|nr:TonB-dependent receptor [Woeseiaceae bacterium]
MPLASCLAALAFPALPAHAAADLFERTIEELGELRVVSVSRRSEPLREAASSIYVITAEDIRRSGFSSIPEILRLAPGVEVARTGAHSWTISIRGFNSDLSNKLLVLIDGRSVYSPLYAGVFWDAQDTLVHDIERIEVISGPGGTLWGANAVNGVINIITRSASETKGSLVELGTGDEQQLSIGLRHGFSLTSDMAARTYLKYTDRDGSRSPSGEDGVDDVGMMQAGFRMDWERDANTRATLQGDIYDGELGSMLLGDFTLGTLPGSPTPGDVDISGHNLLARWNRQLANGGDLRLQAYYDHTTRNTPGSFNEDRDTLDLDFQHHFAASERHNIVWGAGFRWTSDQLDNTLFASFLPDERTDRTFSLFFQDEIGLWDDRAFLTLGAKVERNDYTDFEVQPNIRATWNVADGHTLWAAVSRAVRIPARLNTDLELTVPVEVPGLAFPLYILVSGNDDYQSEELVATELGYRAGLTQDLSLDFSLYYNQYDRLQTQEPGEITFAGEPVPEYVTLRATLENGMEGNAYGGSLVANWQPTPYWKLQFQYAYLEMDLELKPGALDEGALTIAGNSPRQQAAVHSFLELPYDFDIYVGVRYTDELQSLGVPGFTSIDLSLGWQASERLRTSLTVHNLNDDAHLEFGGGNLIERSARLTAVFTF